MPKSQLHKRLTTDQAKAILEKYAHAELHAKEAIRHLEVSRSRFYQLHNKYHQDPDAFTIEYTRESPTHVLDPKIEDSILSGKESWETIEK